MLERPSKLTSYRFDQLADQISQRVMPAEAEVERYVGLEHLDPDSLRIRRWGDPSEVESTKLRFEPGDIIFGKRRVYQRKVAVADSEGICSAHAMVLRAKSDTVLPEFLPFFMQSDLFMERALSISVGSLSPTINWKALAKEEFLLPSIQEQGRLVEVFIAAQGQIFALEEVNKKQKILLQSAILDELERSEAEPTAIGDVAFRVTNGFVGSAVKHYVDDGIPYLRSLNVRRAGLKLDDLVFVSESFHQKTKKSQLKTGDLLTVQSGHVGETAVVPSKCEGWNCHALILTRLNMAIADPDYFALYLNSLLGQRELERFFIGSTVAHLNTSDLVKFCIPLPSIQEQKKIADMGNALLDSIRETDFRIAAAR